MYIGREVVFLCRDEGPIRARVQWVRAENRPLPDGTRDLNGRLEIPNIKVEHSGEYICEAKGYPRNTPGSFLSVTLNVEKSKDLKNSFNPLNLLLFPQTIEPLRIKLTNLVNPMKPHA